MHRRHLLRVAAVAAPLLSLGRVRLFGADRSYSTRAVDLVKRSTVIDMLSPFALSFSRMQGWLSKPETFTAKDLAEFRESGIQAFHVALGIGGPDAYLSVLKFVSGWNSFLAFHNDTCKRIQTTADIDRAKAANQIGVIVGVQNSEHFRTVADV